MGISEILCPLAISLDGKIASFPGESDVNRRSYGFGCEADHQLLLKILSEADAVIIGGRTARAASGVLPLFNDCGVIPPWIVLSRSAAPLVGRDDRGPIWYVGAELDDPLQNLRPLDRIFPFQSKKLADLVPETLRILENEKLRRVVLLGGGEILAHLSRCYWSQPIGSRGRRNFGISCKVYFAGFTLPAESCILKI
jgi:riboflavin biosynthesis pyrimidine reductase